jgi:hypothetical protein
MSFSPPSADARTSSFWRRPSMSTDVPKPSPRDTLVSLVVSFSISLITALLVPPQPTATTTTSSSTSSTWLRAPWWHRWCWQRCTSGRRGQGRLDRHHHVFPEPTCTAQRGNDLGSRGRETGRRGSRRRHRRQSHGAVWG